MKNTDILNRINALLNRKVKLEQQALENGTIIEAEAFEVGQPVFAVDGENKTPLEVGDYIMADGSMLMISEVGVIGEIMAVAKEETEEEVEANKNKGYDMAETPATLEEILTAVVDAIQPKLDELNAKIDALSGSNTEMKATLSKVGKRPLTHKPIESKLVQTKMSANVNLSNTEALIMARLSNRK